MARGARAAARRALIFIALAALARASPSPLECCGDGSCALECTEGCAAAGCAACCDPCAGVVCPPPTAQCKAAGTCSGGTCSTPNAAEGTACDYTASGGDGACVAGACVPAAPAGAWAAVCGGVQFGCGLDAAGRAWCWGTDTSGFGFLGQGATATQTLQFPSPVVGGHLFASITCGYIYVCALTPSGAAYCWGFNGSGNLGVGNTIDLGAPTPVSTAGVATWSKIAAGGFHTCAISAATGPPPGAVWCWGDNSSGQVGVAASPSVPTPLQVAGLVAADVSAGGDFSCAVVGAGVKCWGGNNDGQLGSVTASTPTPQPVLFAGSNAALAGAASVSAGYDFACARAAGGAALWCWGRDDIGQLGNGGTASGGSGAVEVTNPGSITWAEVAAYASSTCGLSTGGAAYCWGSGDFVGAGSSPGDTTVPVPVAAAASPKTWARLGTGAVSYTPLAVAADTTLYGWGQITYYELGNGVDAIGASNLASVPVRAGVAPCTGVTCSSPATCDAQTGFCPP